jgi:chromatin remodeling complex protein RSC6
MKYRIPRSDASGQTELFFNGTAAGRYDVRALPQPSIEWGTRMATKAPAKPSNKSKDAPAKKPRQTPNALQQPLQPSEELAAVVGAGPLPRGEVVSKVWGYIKSNNLQNPENRREILADDKLRKIFSKDKVTMFEMNKHLAQHLK